MEEKIDFAKVPYQYSMLLLSAKTQKGINIPPEAL